MSQGGAKRAAGRLRWGAATTLTSLAMLAVGFAPGIAHAADTSHMVAVNLRPTSPGNAVAGLQATFRTPATPPVFYPGYSTYGTFVFGGIAVGGTQGLSGSQWFQVGWYSEINNPQPRLLVQGIDDCGGSSGTCTPLNYSHFFGPLAADTDYTFRLANVGGSDWAAYLETGPEQLLARVSMRFAGAPWSSARLEMYGSTGGDELIPDLRASGIEADVNGSWQPIACGQASAYSCLIQTDTPYKAMGVQPGWSGFTASDPRALAGRAAAGYWLVGADGGVFSFGGATFHGSTGGMRLSQPVVGMASTPAGQGYWLVASDGGVFSFGDAAFHGSTASLRLSQPVVGMAPTPTGQGYWLVASDGGVFSFGDATFHGSAVGAAPGAAIVGISATPTGGGYWLAASTGQTFAFGDATPLRSPAAASLQRPVTAIAPTPSGRGCWLASSEGGVRDVGDAYWYPPVAADVNLARVVAIASDSKGGFWLADAAGAVLAFGGAAPLGSAAGLQLSARIVGMAAGL